MKVLVNGCIARLPFGGHVWHHLQYVVGLRDLGVDAYFYESCGSAPQFYYNDPRLDPSDPTHGVSALKALMERFGLGDRWACQVGNDLFGLSPKQAESLLPQIDVLINLVGTFPNLGEGLMRIPTRILVDTDPVFTQVRAADGNEANARGLRQHTHFATFAENIGASDCDIPTLGLDWIPTRQPVVLSEWEPRQTQSVEAYATVMNWRGSGSAQPVVWNGKTYGYKDEEFIKFMTLPREVGARMEICMPEKHIREAAPALEPYGWNMKPSEITAATADGYREYIQNSRAEFSAAKNAYVKSRSGWFSERSACFLACGKPVVTQDTGFGVALPAGKGLFAVSDEKEAAEAIHEIERDYETHAAAAKKIAENCFDSGKTLKKLLSDCSVPI